MSIKDFIPGTIGSIFNVYIGHPFDTIKVRMQDINSLYNSPMNCLYNTIKNEGIKGLYKGSTYSLYATMAENSVVFGINGYLKKYVYEKKSLSFGQEMVIGSLSGLGGTIVSCPFETIKCNIQVNSGQTFYDICNKNKISRLYRGFYATCFRNIPFYIFFFPFYTKIKDNIMKYVNGYNISVSAFSGGLGSAITWCIVYPLDVIKCNQQISEQNNSILQTTKRLWKINGIRSFYVGFIPTFVRSFPANAGLLMGVEITNNILCIN